MPRPARKISPVLLGFLVLPVAGAPIVAYLTLEVAGLAPKAGAVEKLCGVLGLLIAAVVFEVVDRMGRLNSTHGDFTRIRKPAPAPEPARPPLREALGAAVAATLPGGFKGLLLDSGEDTVADVLVDHADTTIAGLFTH